MTKKTYKKPQRDKFVAQVAQRGEENKTDVYQEVYNQENRDLARTSAHTLMKHPEVQRQLKKYKTYVAQYATPEDVAKRLAHILFGEDKRASLDAIKEYNKLQDQYPNQANIKYTQEYRQTINQITEEPPPNKGK